MIFEVEFVFPDGETAQVVAPQPVNVLSRRAVFDLREDVQGLQPVDPVEHLQ